MDICTSYTLRTYKRKNANGKNTREKNQTIQHLMAGKQHTIGRPPPPPSIYDSMIVYARNFFFRPCTFTLTSTADGVLVRFGRRSSSGFTLFRLFDECFRLIAGERTRRGEKCEIKSKYRYDRRCVNANRFACSILFDS